MSFLLVLCILISNRQQFVVTSKSRDLSGFELFGKATKNSSSTIESDPWIFMSASVNISGEHQLLKVDAITTNICNIVYDSRYLATVLYSNLYLCDQKGNFFSKTNCCNIIIYCRCDIHQISGWKLQNTSENCKLLASRNLSRQRYLWDIALLYDSEL